MRLEAGRMLQGRYRIVSLLGQGGMGAVYRAWDTRLNAPVALKEMIPQPGLDAETLVRLREQFRREAEVLARLSHPNLVDVMDFFEEGGNAYLVMRYIEGESLAARIAREGQLLESQVLTWAKQLLDALAYCHGRGIIHRDIKPHNVIITPEGQAVLVDFGLVKLWDPADPQTQTVMRGVGTPEYAPPEQYSTEPGHTDPRSDLYSLGAMLYHALAGQAPPSAHVRMADPDRFRPLRQLNPQVSTGTEMAVLKAMTLSRKERVQSTGELVAALEGRAPSPVQPSAPTYRPAKVERETQPVAPARTRRVPVWVWGVGCLALLLVVVAGAIGAGVAAGMLGGGGATPVAGGTPGPSDTPGPPTVPATPVQGTGGPASMPALPVLVGTPVPHPVAAISPDNTGQIVELALLGRGEVGKKAAWSPDGSLLAVGSSVGVWIYDAETLTLVSFFKIEYPVSGVAFSPDGEMLAIGSAGYDTGMVQLRRVSDGALLHTLEGWLMWMVLDVTFSPDGAVVAAGASDGKLRLWRVSDGTFLREMEVGGEDAFKDDVTGVDFSPTGEVLASSTKDGKVRLWRVSDGTLLQMLEGHTGEVWDVVFSPGGEVIASGATDGTVRLWRASDGTLVQALEGHTDAVLSLAFSPDGETLASGSEDETVRLWQVSDGTTTRALGGHADGVAWVGFSPDGMTLASVGDSLFDNTVRQWRVSDGSLLHALEYTDEVFSVAFSPNGEILASGSGDGMAQLWQVSDGTLLKAWEAGTVNIRLVFSPDGTMLATTGSRAQIWRVPDGTLVYKLETEGYDSVYGTAFSPDGETLAAGTSDGFVYLWRVSDGTLLHKLEGHTDYVRGVSFSPDGMTVASGSADKVVRLWQVSDGTLLHTLEGHEKTVLGVVFSPDGEVVVSGSIDSTMRLWQVPGGALLRTLETDSSAMSVAFSPDGTLLAAGTGGGSVQLWRVSDGSLLRTLEGHTSYVRGVAFSPGGTLLASGSEDGTVRLWGVVGE